MIGSESHGAPSPADQRARLARHLLDARSRPTTFPLSFAQERLWFLHQLDPDSPTYHIPGELAFSTWIHEPVLERCLDELVARHESLRTTFEFRDGQAVQVVAPRGRIPLGVVDLRQAAHPGQQLAELRREAML
ncbi:MAG TPA: condensation domain-containing protein, partial [Kofleriaceae bacterium]|nr:condensation domain-containing protein [Kofleriaceae bacterium]